jgi:hypothetical protein
MSSPWKWGVLEVSLKVSKVLEGHRAKSTDRQLKLYNTASDTQNNRARRWATYTDREFTLERHQRVGESVSVK